MRRSEMKETEEDFRKKGRGAPNTSQGPNNEFCYGGMLGGA